MPLDEPEHRGADERQRFTRRSVLLAAKLHVGERLLDVDILDLSEGGAKIAVPEALDVGTEVDLLVQNVGLYPAQVVWRNELHLGLEFLACPTAVAADLPQILETAQDSRERRRHVRSSVLWRAEIYGGIRRSTCEVLNISISGARLRVPATFKPGSEVTVRSIHFGEHKGRVVWQEQDRMGIEFLEFH